MSVLSELLSSRVRAEIFSILFDGKEQEMHVRAIERNSTVSFSSVCQEMKKLARLDLVKKRRDGNRLYYSANTIHPLYPEITGLVSKTIGYVAVLKKALTDNNIQIVFVFGSMAKGEGKAGSDIDLAVIGKIDMRRLTSLLSGCEERVGREINPHIFTVDEFSERVSEEDHFVTRLLSSSKTFIVGTEDELDQICG